MTTETKASLPSTDTPAHLIQIPGPMPSTLFEQDGLIKTGILNCASFLDDCVDEREWGSRVAIIAENGEEWTYAELRNAANAVAAALTQRYRVARGSRVILHGHSTPLMIALWFAVLKAGAVIVTTMPLLKARELAAIATKSGASLALVDHRLQLEVQAAARLAPVIETIIPYGPYDFFGMQGNIRTHKTHYTNAPVQADDPAMIAFTSGSTGRARGTVHFHRDVHAICHCFPTHVLKSDDSDIFITTSPLGFTYGLGAALLFPLSVGAAVILMQTVTPEQFSTLARRYRPTIFFSTPTFFRMLLHTAGHDLSWVPKKCVSAGEPLPAQTRRAWESATGGTLIDGLGSTEMLHIFAWSTGDHAGAFAGKPVPGYRLVVLREDRSPAGPGELGILGVKGPTGCRYLDDVASQTAAVYNGWHLTGDIGYMDEQGRFHHVGRQDDLIVSSGYKLSACEIEEAIQSHPIVQECAVVQVPDWIRGHIIKAYVVLKSDGSASETQKKVIQDHVKSLIAPYKYPREIEFIDALPRTQSGKIQKFRLASRAHGERRPIELPGQNAEH